MRNAGLIFFKSCVTLIYIAGYSSSFVYIHIYGPWQASIAAGLSACLLEFCAVPGVFGNLKLYGGGGGWPPKRQDYF